MNLLFRDISDCFDHLLFSYIFIVLLLTHQYFHIFVISFYSFFSYIHIFPHLKCYGFLALIRAINAFNWKIRVFWHSSFYFCQRRKNEFVALTHPGAVCTAIRCDVTRRRFWRKRVRMCLRARPAATTTRTASASWACVITWAATTPSTRARGFLRH